MSLSTRRRGNNAQSVAFYALRLDAPLDVIEADRYSQFIAGGETRPRKKKTMTLEASTEILALTLTAAEIATFEADEIELLARKPKLLALITREIRTRYSCLPVRGGCFAEGYYTNYRWVAHAAGEVAQADGLGVSHQRAQALSERHGWGQEHRNVSAA